MELGPHEQTLAKQAMRAGQPIPDRIANAPELEPGLQLYMQAFFDLDSERSHAMGLVAIPWSSIASYAMVFDFDEEQTDDLFFFIRQMDKQHLKTLAEKQKQAQANAANKGKNGK